MILAYCLFVLAAAALFRFCRVRDALLATYLGGWMLLPVGSYPVGLGGSFAWWITGLAVPSAMLVTKAWTAALAALIGALVVDHRTAAAWRPSLVDLPMLGWCVWPLVGDWLVAYPAPPRPLSTLYLIGSWGIPWLIGRVWFQERAAQRLLVAALALAAGACLPFALIEGVRPAFLYTTIYGPHPFADDGVVRYLGYRPLALFEDGNQYGIWTACGALAAAWLAAGDRRWWPVAAVALLVAIAAQSVGAIALLAAGLALMLLWRSRLVLPLLAAGALAIGVVGALHLSGVVPLQTIARDTRFGQATLDAVRGVGRGSFTWRISQDTRALAAVHASPLVGAQRWDWFFPLRTRPWGLALLTSGQFGLIGFACWAAALGLAAGAALVRTRGDRATAPAAAPLALGLVVLMALGDSLLNAFFYFPAIIAAGAIVERGWQARRADRASISAR